MTDERLEQIRSTIARFKAAEAGEKEMVSLGWFNFFPEVFSAHMADRDRLAAENAKLRTVADVARYTILALELEGRCSDLERALAALDDAKGPTT